MSQAPRIELTEVRKAKTARLRRALAASNPTARRPFHARGGKAIGGKPPSVNP